MQYQKMQSTICILFIAIAASKCRAKVRIMQGNDISIEFDKPLEITFTNDKTSDVVFRHQQSVVAYCHRTHGCSIDDGRFHITQNTSAGRNEYILKSNDAIQTDLCGVYECKDLLYLEKHSANVSIIGFDNDTYNATEEKDTIYLTTACIFHVSLSDMQIFWYTYDNATLKLLDETRMENSMSPFNSESVCSDECGTLSAYKFTFGLNITDQEQGYTNAFIETKIFHPDYMNKPLTWRSSETFRVKDSRPKTPTSQITVALAVMASLLQALLIGYLIYAYSRLRRIRTTSTLFKAQREEIQIIKHKHRDEYKNSQSDSAIGACGSFQENRSTNFETRVNTALLEEQCLLLSDSSESIKHSQSEGAIESREKRSINFETGGNTASQRRPFTTLRRKSL